MQIFVIGRMWLANRIVKTSDIQFMRLLNSVYKTIILVLLAWTLLSLSGCIAVIHSEKDYDITVTDADSGKPVSGVDIIAIWGDWGYGMEGGTYHGAAKIMDAASDANGRVHFPAWGPSILVTSYVLSSDPQLVVYKTGYQLVITNKYGLNYRQGAIQLRRNNGSYAAILKTSGKMYEELRREETGICDWENMPNLMIMQVRDKIDYHKNKQKLPPLYVDEVWRGNKYFDDAGCRSGKKYIVDVYLNYLEKTQKSVNTSTVRRQLADLFRSDTKPRGKVIIISPGNNYLMVAKPPPGRRVGN